jgi:hypothetical protein
LCFNDLLHLEFITDNYPKLMDSDQALIQIEPPLKLKRKKFAVPDAAQLPATYANHQEWKAKEQKAILNEVNTLKMKTTAMECTDPEFMQLNCLLQNWLAISSSTGQVQISDYHYNWNGNAKYQQTWTTFEQIGRSYVEKVHQSIYMFSNLNIHCMQRVTNKGTTLIMRIPVRAVSGRLTWEGIINGGHLLGIINRRPFTGPEKISILQSRLLYKLSAPVEPAPTRCFFYQPASRFDEKKMNSMVRRTHYLISQIIHRHGDGLKNKTLYFATFVREE